MDKVMTKTDSGELQEVALPEFLCHKRVRAAKVVAIAPVPGEGLYRLALEGGLHVDVTKHWMGNKVPVVGGYYVQYEDGYASFSPATAFETGYELIPDGTPLPEYSAVPMHRLVELSLKVASHGPDLEICPDAVVPSACILIDRLAASTEAQGSGSERYAAWTETGDGTGYPVGHGPGVGFAVSAGKVPSTDDLAASQVGPSDPAAQNEELPSASDLDAVAEDEKARSETGASSDGPTAIRVPAIPGAEYDPEKGTSVITHAAEDATEQQQGAAS